MATTMGNIIDLEDGKDPFQESFDDPLAWPVKDVFSRHQRTPDYSPGKDQVSYVVRPQSIRTKMKNNLGGFQPRNDLNTSDRRTRFDQIGSTPAKKRSYSQHERSSRNLPPSAQRHKNLSAQSAEVIPKKLKPFNALVERPLEISRRLRTHPNAIVELQKPEQDNSRRDWQEGFFHNEEFWNLERRMRPKSSTTKDVALSDKAFKTQSLIAAKRPISRKVELPKRQISRSESEDELQRGSVSSIDDAKPQNKRHSFGKDEIVNAENEPRTATRAKRRQHLMSELPTKLVNDEINGQQSEMLPKPVSSPTLRGKFVRDSGANLDDSIDELQRPDTPVVISEPLETTNQPILASTSFDATNDNMPSSDGAYSDLPNNDLTKTPFVNSPRNTTIQQQNVNTEKVKTRPRRAQKDVENPWITTKLQAFNHHSGNKMECALRTKRGNKEYFVNTNISEQAFPFADIRTAFLSDNGVRAILMGRQHEEKLKSVARIVFESQDELKKFESILLHNAPDIISKHGSDDWVRKVDEKIQDQSKNRSTTKLPDLDEEINLINIRVANGKKANKPVKESVISRMKPSADVEPRIGAATRSHLAPSLLGNPEVEVSEKRPQRTSRARTSHNDTAAACEETPPSRLAKPYSVEYGLGEPWKKGLIYPSKGLNRAFVEFEDLIRLDDGEFLNDNLIAFALKYSQLQTRSTDDRVLFFNTFFYQNLIKDRGMINYAAVSRWTVKTPIFNSACNYVVVPICENLHWYVAIICNVRALELKEIGSSANSEVEKPVPEHEEITRGLSRDDDPKVPETEMVGPIRANSEDTKLAQEATQMSIDSSPGEDSSKRPKNLDIGLQSQLGLKSEPVDISPHPKLFKTKSKMADEKPTRKLTLGRLNDPTEPLIITLDSLGSAHPVAAKTLKTYLKLEATEKVNCDIVQVPPAMTAKGIPLQQTLSDCGLFMIAYVAKFLEDPEAFVRKAVMKEFDDSDWIGIDAATMRHNIRSIVLREHKNQEESSNNSSKKASSMAESDDADPRSVYEQFTSSVDDSAASVPANEPKEPKKSKEKSPQVLKSVSVVEIEDSQDNGLTGTTKEQSTQENSTKEVFTEEVLAKEASSNDTSTTRITATYNPSWSFAEVENQTKEEDDIEGEKDADMLIDEPLSTEEVESHNAGNIFERHTSRDASEEDVGDPMETD